MIRLVQVLEHDSDDQLLYYDPGVGTLAEPGRFTRIEKKISEWVSLAFGTGLTQNVEEAYAFLMDFCEPGDRVFLFGFSRGAYTVRVLAGLLHSVGLLPSGSHNMVPYAMRLYAAAREGVNQEYFKRCKDFRWTYARAVPGGGDQRHFPVHFLGLWDTVSSVGWVWDPVTFVYTSSNPSIKCHPPRGVIGREAVVLPAESNERAERSTQSGPYRGGSWRTQRRRVWLPRVGGQVVATVFQVDIARGGESRLASEPTAPRKGPEPGLSDFSIPDREPSNNVLDSDDA